MSMLSFKDVGIKGPTIQDNNGFLTRREPIGIKTPLELDGANYDNFTMHYTVKDQVTDNLRNLLLTNHGDRVMHYDFGANLLPLVADFSHKDDFDQEAMVRINTAITKFMPFVTPLGFASKPDYENNQYTGKIDIVMTYAVPLANVTDGKIEVSLYVM
jgi:phage baseplate assembly protein W